MKTPNKFKLEINLGNAAMQAPEHLADLLQKVSVRLERHDQTFTDKVALFDINGNKVGYYRLYKGVM